MHKCYKTSEVRPIKYHYEYVSLQLSVINHKLTKTVRILDDNVSHTPLDIPRK